MPDPQASEPLIIGFVSDLMFQVQIAAVARQLGFDIAWIAAEADLAPVVHQAPNRPNEPGENLYGREGRLLDQLARRQPALLLFDLGSDAIPWRAWLPRIKSSPATKRIPVVAFAAHVDRPVRQTARSLGAELVVTRARLAADLPDILQRHARIPDYASLEAACAGSLAPAARAGIEAYNEGRFYDAHEDLELAWQAEPGPARDLYRAILQVAVACYQIRRGNYNGALKMLLRVQQWLQPLPPRCQGVDVARLKADVVAVHGAVSDLGPERIGEFDWQLVRPVRVDETPDNA